MPRPRGARLALPHRTVMAAPVDSPALSRILLGLAGLVPLERVDALWVFPPRRVAEVESGLLVLALLPAAGDADDLREVVTVQYERRGKAAMAAPELTGRGWAPADRVPTVIAGVVRRLGSAEQEPETERIGGDPSRYAAFLERLGVATVDPANGE